MLGKEDSNNQKQDTNVNEDYTTHQSKKRVRYGRENKKASKIDELLRSLV